LPAVSMSNVPVPETAGEKENRISTEGDWTEPRPNWKARDYRLAFHFAFLDKDELRAETIDRAYLGSDEANDELNQRVWEAYREWTRIQFGQAGKLDRLRELALSHPSIPQILNYLALALSYYGLHKESAKVFEAASKTNVPSDERLRFLGRSVLEHVLEGRSRTETVNDIEALKETAVALKCSQLTVLRVLEAIYKATKDLDTLLLVQQGIVELDPSDRETRFSLAYELEAKGDRELSLFHFQRCLLPNVMGHYGTT
jgi:tetratricopeptide (TPR) repeat protein